MAKSTDHRVKAERTEIYGCYARSLKEYLDYGL